MNQIANSTNVGISFCESKISEKITDQHNQLIIRVNLNSTYPVVLNELESGGEASLIFIH